MEASIEKVSARFLVSAEEHAEIEVEPDLVYQNGRLNIYPEVARLGVVGVSSRGDRLVLRAGSWVGVLPINDRFAVEVKPRVPVRNLERILLCASDPRINVLAEHARAYQLAEERVSDDLVDLLAERLVALTTAIHVEGLLDTTVRVDESGTSGAIDPIRTAIVQVRGRPHAAHIRRWVRIVDTPANQVIRAAIRKLIGVYQVMPGRHSRKRMTGHLAQADRVLSRVSRCVPTREMLERTWIGLLTNKDLTPNYREAFHVARTILSDGGVRFSRTAQGLATLGTVLVNMEDAFEKFFRQALLAESAKRSRLRVLDGNIEPPVGARRKLYVNPSSRAAGKVNVSPDIVVLTRDADLGASSAAVDVKYKVIGALPDRDDVNQVLTYALAYQLPYAFIAVPHRKALQKTLEVIGEVGGVSLGVIRVDLDADDLMEEMRRVYFALEAQLS